MEKLGNYILDIAAGPFGSNLKVECFVPKGFPIIDGANLKSYKVTDNITKFVTEEKARSLHRSIARKNDVVVTISGNVGQISYIPYNSMYDEYLVSQRQFRVTFDTSRVYVPFLVYYFHTKEGQHKILSFANQTGVPALAQPLKNFRNIDIELPDLKTQQKIAQILESIDNKIENNCQINDNLEQQAQAAFNNIIANTTSDKTVQLSEIAWLNPKRSISKGKVVRSIEMAHLPTTGSFPSGWEMKEYNGGMKFQNGDTLMARITPCLENGKVAFVNFLEDDEIAFGSTEYITMTPKRQFAPEVLYFLVRNAEFIDFAVKNMNGSSGRQRVSADTIGTFELPDITLEELHMLETIAREALTKIKYNSLENMRLAEMRDTLLPKLMSGELKINEIDC